MLVIDCCHAQFEVPLSWELMVAVIAQNTSNDGLNDIYYLLKAQMLCLTAQQITDLSSCAFVGVVTNESYAFIVVVIVNES